MADPIVYTFSDLLCFASYAVNKIASKPLKSLISDFYTQEAIASAKGMLLDYLDSQGEHSELNVSRRRRDSVTKQSLDVDDILKMFTYADEHNISLPPFVSLSPNRMPSIRLAEGDLQIMWTKIERLEEVLNKIQESLTQVSELGNINNSLQLQAAIDIKANNTRCQDLSSSLAVLGPVSRDIVSPVRKSPLERNKDSPQS